MLYKDSILKRGTILIRLFWVAVLYAVLTGCAHQSGKTETKEATGASSEQAIHNAIRWKTSSEVNNFGYDIFRGSTEDGPFEKLTEKPLAGAGTTDLQQSYEFLDYEIEPGTVYYYYVESISMDGEREKFTPVFPSKPKYLANP